MNVPVKKLRGFQSVYRKSLEQPLPTLERTRKASSSGGRGKTRRRCGPKESFCCFKEIRWGKGPHKAEILESSSVSGLAEMVEGVSEGVSSPDFSPGVAEEIGGIPFGSFLNFPVWGHSVLT